MSVHDALTGLFSREYLFAALGQELDRHRRYGGVAALAVFDVDDMRRINARHGRAAGDAVLREVGARLAHNLRPSDTVARVGPEEFGVLLPEAGQADGLLAAERLRTTIARETARSPIPVTVSAGVVAIPLDGETIDELERNADAALAFAKCSGKNVAAVPQAAGEDAPDDRMLGHLRAVVAGIDGYELATHHHSENVAAYAIAVAQELALPAAQVVRLHRAAFLHDIGKVAVPVAVLEKPEPLTPEEFEQVKLHSAVGATMLEHAGLRAEAIWVRHHHERIDGGGYPDGLTGTDIPIESRVILVVDSFEAMTSDRPYRRGMSVAEAVAELHAHAGTQFDPHVVSAFERVVADGRPLLSPVRHLM
jgi:diguanylate cyclase (GGDEF)-like protein/putative nucleotidyltransferase with HDIG domain